VVHGFFHGVRDVEVSCSAFVQLLFVCGFRLSSYPLSVPLWFNGGVGLDLCLLSVHVFPLPCAAPLQVSAAKTSFFVARITTGLRTQVTGVMGRRTKFQTFDIPQLVVHAASTPTLIEYTRVAARGGGVEGEQSIPVPPPRQRRWLAVPALLG
jgi:hypothetical protein